jgi:tetratricopeptide (TPR) repeat protein
VSASTNDTRNRLKADFWVNYHIRLTRYQGRIYRRLSRQDSTSGLVQNAALALQKKNSAESLKLYRPLEAGFKREGISGAELYFNLAQALETNDRYKGAMEYYQSYLKINPQAADKALVEQKIINSNKTIRPGRHGCHDLFDLRTEVCEVWGHVGALDND